MVLNIFFNYLEKEMKTIIENANIASSFVMPTTREQQWAFTVEGSLTRSAVWGMAANIVSSMREDSKVDEAQQDRFYNAMLDRISFVIHNDLASDKQIAEVIDEAVAGIQAQRPDAETAEIFAALGVDGVDSDEVEFFSNLNRSELKTRLESAVHHASLGSNDTTTAVESWVAAKSVAFVERQLDKLTAFDKQSSGFKRAWVRANNRDIRVMARKSKVSIGEATVAHVESLLDKIENVLNKIEEVQDEIEARFETEKEVDQYASHPDRQF